MKIREWKFSEKMGEWATHVESLGLSFGDMIETPYHGFVWTASLNGQVYGGPEPLVAKAWCNNTGVRLILVPESKALAGNESDCIYVQDTLHEGGRDSIADWLFSIKD